MIKCRKKLYIFLFIERERKQIEEKHEKELREKEEKERKLRVYRKRRER